MMGSQKSKRITWAPDVNLCQVRLFSSAHPPSEVRKSNVGHLRGKAAQGVQSNGNKHNDNVAPPGFEKTLPRLNGPQIQTQPRLKLPQRNLTKWRCPPRFVVNSEWLVASGEESKEIGTQNRREKRVLEAIYPRPSAIPPNPHAPVDAGESVVDDRNIPVIPIKPIEETEETDAELAACDANIVETPVQLKQEQVDVVAAAAAAHAALALASNPSLGNLIDHDLLLRMLSDQKLLQQLLFASNGASSQCVPVLKKAESKNGSYSVNFTTPELNAPELRRGFVPPMKDRHDTSSQYIPELKKVEPKHSQYIPEFMKVEPKHSQYIPELKKVEPMNSQYIPELKKVEPKHSQYIPEFKKVEPEKCLYSTQITMPELNAPQLRTGFVPPMKDRHDASSQCMTELKAEPKNSQYFPELKKVEPDNSQYIPELKKVEPMKCLYSNNITRPELNAPQLRTEFVPPVKDISYLKNLIQQHGGANTQDGPPPSHGQSNWAMGTTQEDESRSRRRKRCMFFNSPRGCKNGANCTYLHDTVSSRQMVNCFTEDQTAKRVKRNWIHS